ncbi:MAG TPA: hypothetical protein VGX46_16510 [Vicinamibacterales bacterium]|nr:hypothetical protein [Vicinamibacterales bacterium]
MHHGPGAPSDANIPRLKHLERGNRGVAQGPQFLRLSGVADLLFAPELGDGGRNRVVQAPVQRAKVIRADGRRQFNRQIGDGLTDIAVVVHDLSNCEPLTQEVLPVLDGALPDLGGLRRPLVQLVGKLIKEQGDSASDLRLGRRWSRPLRHLRSAATDELVAIDANEFRKRDSPHPGIVCQA